MRGRAAAATALTRAAATIAVGALVALGLGGTPASASPQASTRTLTWKFTYHGARNAIFQTVAAVSQDDVWATGDYTSSQTAFVLHWNGRYWGHVAMPDPQEYLPYVSAASSADDVWLIGFHDTTSGAAWNALRWTGDGWRSQSLPSLPSDTGITGLAVTSWKDAWVSGSPSCTPEESAQPCSTPLWHWNGSEWQSYTVPFGVSSLTSSPASNVWVAGYLPDGGSHEIRVRIYAARWTGTTFTSAGIAHRVSHCLPQADTTSAHDTWIQACAVRGKEDGLGLHWNGHSWQSIWNIADGQPIIDWPLGVWFGPNYRWTGKTGAFALLPGNTTGDWPCVTRVPGTSTLLALGEEQRIGAKASTTRTFAAIIGGPFGRFR